MHLHTYTIEDVQIQRNRLNSGLKPNENFPFDVSKKFTDTECVKINPKRTITKSDKPIEKVTFVNDSVKKAFKKLYKKVPKKFLTSENPRLVIFFNFATFLSRVPMHQHRYKHRLDNFQHPLKKIL